MPITPTYPGVYTKEAPSKVRTIAGVSTSTAVFIGRASKGPRNNPTDVLSIKDYKRIFGELHPKSHLAQSVKLFFQNGGTECYVIRVAQGTPSSKEPLTSNDDTKPLLSDYLETFKMIDKKIDLFNLMILPKDAEHDATTIASLWGPASNFCKKRRAFLLMDAPAEWQAVADVIDSTSGINSLRQGLVKENAAIFYPQVKISDNDIVSSLGPSGAIAGLMARIDSTRGVWEAPAGIEADIRGIVDLDIKLTDKENGVLNPEGVNCLRSFPSGIVNWGARTVDSADDFSSEWKYIHVRRLALFIEESLYRGTKWVVFEPNDEPLWAQIRLNVGSFMHSLFRKGAFQGIKPSEAYFVKCDSETTTQDGINKGIVNILVGFAPLKPSEFVIIKISQIAGKLGEE